MIKASYLWIFLGLIAFACGSSEKETKSGFKYTVLKAGTGEVGKPNEIVVFNFELRDNKDSLWNDSYKMELPVAIQIPDTTRMRATDPVMEMITELKKGDSVKANISVPKFFEKLAHIPVPAGVDSTGTLTYRVKVVDIMTLEKFYAWRGEAVKKRDDKMIQDYLTKNNLKAERDTSGVYYVLYNNSNGPKPTVNDCVDVKYQGKFLVNGRPFDAAEHANYPLAQMIPGWQYGIPKISKGDSATLFIPSHLAYGNGGRGMPPDAILIFDVMLHDFKATYDPEKGVCK